MFNIQTTVREFIAQYLLVSRFVERTLVNLLVLKHCGSTFGVKEKTVHRLNIFGPND